ncbi:MAG: L,D-transpeptidase [Chitinispirillaceae bacterium]|nr:L,D-transpeptidase [Chitinispirillaceae bacterium]
MDRLFLFILAVVPLTATAYQLPGRIDLSATVDSVYSVHLSLGGVNAGTFRSITVYRSFNDLSLMGSLDLDAWPITKRVFSGNDCKGEIIDSLTAHHTTYTYYVKAETTGGTVIPSNVASVVVPDIMLPAPGYPLSLFIDKCNYFLEVRFGHQPVKRFPVNVGSNPRNRKLHYDCRSTPEGIYTVSYTRPKTDFHKAIGVSYPNKFDRMRYSAALSRGSIPLTNGKPASIGGSIQIHGGGIGNNWTWGCIAMRNEDLDQLFRLPELRSGVPIIIVGTDFTRDSVLSADTM